MGQIKRHGHVVLRLVDGIAEHHALIAGTLLFFLLAVDTASDVVALLMDSTEDAARVGVELIFRLGITYAVDGLAGQRLQVYILTATHLAGDDHLTCRNECFHGHASLRVVGQQLVEDGV